MRKKFVFGFVAALGVSVLAPPVTDAQSEEVSPSASTVIVLAPKTDSNLTVADLMSALQSQLEELGIAVVLSTDNFTENHPVDNQHQNNSNVLAFVWLVEHDKTLTVHFYEAAGASLRERRIPVSGTDAVSLEEVAIIVRSAVGALLERAEKEEEEALPASPSPAVEPPAQVENVTPEQPLPSPLALGLGMSLSRYSSVTPYQAGLRGLISLRPPTSFWELSLAYTYIPAATVADQSVTMTLSRHPIELFYAGDYRFTNVPLFVGGALGLLMDPIKRHTSSTDSETAPTDDEWRTSWAASLQLRAGWFATPLLRVYAAAGTEILLKSHDQVVGGEPPRILVTPLPIRPILIAGISINVP